MAQYRCIGSWRFVSTEGVDASPAYQEALVRLQPTESQDVLLDMACCVGQVIRKLVADGVNSSRLLGADIHPEFIDIGYDLFRDRDTLRATFVAGDLFDRADPGFGRITGRPTIVHAQAFFHLFDWPTQVAAAVRLVELLKPDDLSPHAALIFGRQMGSREGKEVWNIRGGTRFAHSPESFQRMWDEVGGKTGTRWRVDAELESRSRQRRQTSTAVDGDGMERGSLQFVVRRLR